MAGRAGHQPAGPGQRRVGLSGGASGAGHSAEELAQYVWPGTHVSKTTLRGCVWEIRQALTTRPPPPVH